MSAEVIKTPVNKYIVLMAKERQQKGQLTCFFSRVSLQTKAAPAVSTEGCNYGSLSLDGTNLKFFSPLLANKQIFDVKLDSINQCVVPASNRDEIEIQFVESQQKEKQQDCLVQMTFHFPAKNFPMEKKANEDNGNKEGEEKPEDEQDADEEEGGVSMAEKFQQQIIETGVLKSVMGDIIVEFSKEQGNFVAPRGRYDLKMTSTYLHMQGKLNISYFFFSLFG